jgi:hypothetical protein
VIRDALLGGMTQRREIAFAASDSGEVSPEVTQRMQLRGLLSEQQGNTDQD